MAAIVWQFAGIQHPHGVLVIQLRHEARFAGKAFGVFGVFVQDGPQDLDDHLLASLAVHAGPELAVAAFVEQFAQFKASFDHGSGGKLSHSGGLPRAGWTPAAVAIMRRCCGGVELELGKAMVVDTIADTQSD